MAAYDDIATLGIKADTSNLSKAISKLEELQKSAQKTETATERFSRQCAAAAKSTDNLGNSALAMGRAFASAVSSIMAAVGAYKALMSLKSFAQRGVEFNSAMEQSKIGIGVLVASMTELEDAQGRALKGMEKYAAAQGIAADLMKEIQRLGLETTATTQELVQGMQVIMAPAIKAGMTLKEIPKFAASAAQALQTIGIPIEQMRTEIDALLNGVIGADDKLAPALFYEKSKAELGDYIRSLKESGKLLDELNKRFEYFRMAGQDVANTFKGLASNLDEALDVVAGGATQRLTEQLKEILKVSQSLLITTESGATGISEDFKHIAEALELFYAAVGEKALNAVNSFIGSLKELNVYIGEVGAENFFDDIVQGAQLAGAALLALAVARKAATAEFTIANAAEQTQVTGLRNYIVALGEKRAALHAEAVAEQQAATAAHSKALAELEAFRTTQQSAIATRNSQQAEIIRAAALKQEQALLTAVTAAETRLNVARKATLATTRTMTAAAGALNTARGALAGLVSFMGGPLGIALTAAAVGFTYLTTSQDKATTAADALVEAEGRYQKAVRGSVSETGELIKKLDDYQRKQLEILQRATERSWNAQLEDMANSIRGLSISKALVNPETMLPDQFVPDSYIESLQDLFNALKDGYLDVNDFRNEITTLQAATEKAGYANSDFVKYLESLHTGGALEELAKLEGKLIDLINVSKQAKTGVQQVVKDAAAIQIDEKKLKESLDKSEWAKNYSELNKQQQAYATGLKGVVKDEVALQIARAGSADSIEGLNEASKKQINTILKNTDAARKNEEAFKATTTAAKKDADARKKAEEVLADFNYRMVQLSGNQDAIRKASIDREIEQQRKKFEEAKIPAEQYNEQLEKMRGLLEEQEADKNLQMAADFYKELAERSGKYGKDIALQNKLIEKQAKNWEKAGIPVEDIRDMVRLMQLDLSTDPFDGAYRGLLRFEAEYSNSATQWEEITYGFASDFESTTRGMFDEFLDTGKVSFDSLSDLFKQLLKDMAYQALVQPIVMSVVGGVAGAMSSGSAGGGGAAGGAGGASGLTGMAMGAAQSYAIGKITDGVTTSLVGQLDSWAASLFPNTFAPTTAVANANYLTNAGIYSGGYGVQAPTSTLSGSFAGAAPTIGGAGLGAGIGSMASPFVNNLLGIQNNSGSQIGSTIGGLGATAVLGTMAATNFWNPGGWVAGGLAALSAIAGGALGGLFGGGKKDPPELHLFSDLDLWKDNTSPIWEHIDWGGRYKGFFNDSGGFGAGAAVGLGADTAYQVAESMSTAVHGLVDQVHAVGDALGQVDASLEQQYMKALEAQGHVQLWRRFDGEYINEENLQAYFDELTGMVQEHMVRALGSINLTPLAIAADGFAADTVEELTTSLSNIFSFANIASTIQDEELRAEMLQQSADQITYALKAIHLEPLRIAADGLAVDTVDELSKSLEDVFSLYDLTATVSDETLRANLQAQMGKKIEDAFSKIDMSFLRLDFDQSTFAGLQHAYAAIQALNTVTDSIESIVNPTSQLETTMDTAVAQFDGWIKTLEDLGWQAEAVAEVEARRTEYLNAYYDAATRAATQDLALRSLALQYGKSSSQYADKSLEFSQQNELDQYREEFGEDSYQYQHLLDIQAAERTQAKIDQLTDELNRALQAQAQARRAQAQAQYDAARAGLEAAQALKQATESRVHDLERELEEARRAEQEALQEAIDASQGRLDDLQSELDAAIDAQKRLVDSLQAELDAAIEAQKKLVDDLQAELEAAVNAQIESINNELAEAERLRDVFADLVDMLKDARRDLWASEHNLMGTSFQESRSAFDTTYAKAMSGDEEAMRQLPALGTALLTQGRENLATSTEYTELFYEVDQKLKATQLHSATQVALHTNEIEALEHQIANLESIIGQNKKTHRQIEEIQYDLSVQKKILEEQTDIEEESLRTFEEIRADLEEQQAILEQQTETGEESLRTFQEIRDDIANEQLLLEALLAEQEAMTGEQETTHREIADIEADLERERALLEEQNALVEEQLALVEAKSNALNSAINAGTTATQAVGRSVEAIRQEILALQEVLEEQKTVIATRPPDTTVDDIVNPDPEPEVTPDVTPDATPDVTPSTKPEGPQRLSTPTGIYGSYYETEADLMAAKASINDPNDPYLKAHGASEWTAALAKQEILDEGLTIKEWYQEHGKLEGLATGGITPVNTPFWVGENGPELMMTRQQYGVLSNPDSMALLSRAASPAPRGGDSAALIAEIRELKSYVRQLLVKSDKTAYNTEKSLGLMRIWNAEGLLTQPTA